MSFCPFCAQELPDDGASSCVFCGKRLPTAGAQPAQGVEPAGSDKKTVMGMHALSAPPPGGSPAPPQAPNRSTVKGFAASQGSKAGASAWPDLPNRPAPSAAPPPARPAQAVPAAPTPPAMPPATPPRLAAPDEMLSPDDMAKTVMDDAPIMPIPSVKVEGGPYEIEDPTPRDPPGTAPPLWHPEAEPAPSPAPPLPPPGGVAAAPPSAAPPPSPLQDPLSHPLQVQATTDDMAMTMPDGAPVMEAAQQTEEKKEEKKEEKEEKEEKKEEKAKPTAQEQMGNLPPMPSEGPSGFFAGLGYFFKVTGARWKRGRVKLAFQWETFHLEKDLKKVQEELGRHAWTSRLENPLLTEQAAALDGLETQRSAAQQERQRQAQLTAQEEQAFAGTKEDLEAKIQAAGATVDTFKAEVSEKSAELKNLRQRQSQEQKEVSRLASQRKATEGKAGKAKDAEQQASLSQEAAQIGLDVRKAEERKAITDKQVAELSGPVDELNARLAEARAAKAGLDKELAAAKAELNKKTQASRDEEKKQATEEERLDKEISRALTAMGQTMDEQRLAGPGLDAYYGRLNGLREEIQEKERSIGVIDAERENYNKKAYKNGVIVLATTGGLALAITLTLVLLFTFVIGQ